MRFRKSVIFLILTALILTLSSTIIAVDYQEARENENLRQQYLESILEEYPPPEDVRNINYTQERHESATMSVNYLPHLIDGSRVILRLRMKVYPQAFEEYAVEDDFISTLLHEYNHVRALNRRKIVDCFDSKEYIEINRSGNLTQTSSLLSIKTRDFFNPNVTFNLTWEDLRNLENYDSEKVNDDEDLALMMIRKFIKSHALEMLAVGEEIWLHQNKLNPSHEFANSRYSMYTFHYLEMVRGLSYLGANDQIADSLKALFYRDFLSEQENFEMLLTLYE